MRKHIRLRALVLETKVAEMKNENKEKEIRGKRKRRKKEKILLRGAIPR